MEAAANDDTTAITGTPEVRQLEVPRNVPPSAVHAEPGKVALWDALSAGEFDAELRRLKERTDLSPAQKLQHITARLMYDNAYVELTRIPGDNNENYKHLRIYAHQRGELYSHAAALMTDPELTIEIAFRPERGLMTYEWDAHQTHIAHLGTTPSGLPAHQADAAVMYRMMRGESTRPHSPRPSSTTSSNWRPSRCAMPWACGSA